MRICIKLPRAKWEIFRGPKFICIELPIPIPTPIPKGDPGPIEHLHNLATIVTLTASLPERLPMRSELHELALRALDAAVADLGDGVELHKKDVQLKTTQEK